MEALETNFSEISIEKKWNSRICTWTGRLQKGGRSVAMQSRKDIIDKLNIQTHPGRVSQLDSDLHDSMAIYRHIRGPSQ